MKQPVFLVLIFVMSFISCDDLDKDMELPGIDLTSADAFPQNCVSVYRGESFEFRFVLTDNVELGSYSIEMHHNFDHHTHSTSPVQCEFDPVKQAVKPFLFIRDFIIPEGKKEYQATGTILIPSDVDTGDYHFMIRVTDKAGWQTFRGLSVKIVSREG